jgi:hypothetical protein
MQKDTSDIADVDVVSLEMAFENDEGAIINCTVNEIIYEQIQAHARGHAKDGGESEADAIFALEHGFFGFDLAGAVERDWVQWRLFRAGDSGLADTVAAVGDGHEDPLGGGCEAAE